MIRNAAGMLNSRTPVTATTNRTMSRFALRTSSTSGPTNSASRIVTTGATTRTSSISGRTTLPRAVMLPQARFSAVMRSPPLAPALWSRSGSLVHAAHDGIKGGHHGHRVGDQVVPHQQADELEVDERRVVDLHPERLVRPVRDGVRPVQASRRLDGRPRATRPGTQQARELRHDRPIQHVVEALVDDPQALAHLVDPQQVPVQRVAAPVVAAGRDVELELVI